MFQSKKTKWRTLENAAKIFPATSNAKDERVFRFACELNENVIPEALQQAVDESMEDFSLFACVMRKGLFWNYLEESDLKPIVREEYKEPCDRMYERDQKNLLFEVTYFKRRINLEVYHALADGTGVMWFLKTIVYRYLIQIHPDQVKGPVSKLDIDMTDYEQTEDSFEKYYEKEKKNIKIPRYKSFQLRYPKLQDASQSIMEGIAPVDKLIEASHKYHTTVTVLLTAVFFCAIAKEMSPAQRKKPVALMIPVNLRQFFPSASGRNYFSWIDIGYDFSKESDKLEDVISYVSAFFKREITRERMAYRVNEYVGIEHKFILRMVPLEIKTRFLQLGNWQNRNSNTAIFSNVGKVTMPEECRPFIRLFDFFTSTPHMQLCMCSYGNNMVMSFTSVFENTTMRRNFFRMLTQMGIPVEIAARP